MCSDHPNVNIETEFDKFVDYWQSIPGSKGRKLDWNATFRNWIRNAAEKKTPRNGSNPNPTGLSTVDQKVLDWGTLAASIRADDDPEPEYADSIALDERKGLES